MRLFSLKKSFNVVLVFSVLLIYLLNAVGCAPGLADWSYALLASVNPDQSQTGDFDQFQPEDYRQSPAALSLGLPPCM